MSTLNRAICPVCGKQIGVGVASDDVYRMAVTIHTMCLPALYSEHPDFKLGNNVYNISLSHKGGI
jgi:hypothetical protein